MKKTLLYLCVLTLAFVMTGCSQAKPNGASASDAATVVMDMTVSASNAVVSGSNAIASASNAVASASNATAASPSTYGYDPNMVIVFDDAELEKAVRESMKRPTGDILVSDALAVDGLDFQRNGVDTSEPLIQSLDALKYFTNLTYLGMGYAVGDGGDPVNGIDLSPLAGMTKLTSLQMACVPVSDISVVKNMPYLVSFTAWGGGLITDISPLASLTNLQALTIRENKITDVSPLAGMTNLIYLDISDNQITDVTPLASLVNLERLYISNNPAKDLTSLAAIRAKLNEWDFEAVVLP
ncbi:MAG: leucine-rich repeat domain-containing protein [Clostridiaceae bacterium]